MTSGRTGHKTKSESMGEYQLLKSRKSINHSIKERNRTHEDYILGKVLLLTGQDTVPLPAPVFSSVTNRVPGDDLKAILPTLISHDLHKERFFPSFF